MVKKYIPQGHEDPIITLCRMVTESAYNDLPDDVSTFAKYSILDTLGVMLGGTGRAGIAPVVELAKEKGGKEESHIICYGGKVPAASAAMAMGPMTRSMDFAQLHPVAYHCSEHTLPALMAALGLQKKVSGKEFIAAFTLGQEVMIRIALSCNLEKAVSMGFGGGQYIFGSVAGVGKLIGLSQQQLEMAEGIGRQMTQPHDRSMFYPMTLMVRVHQGFVAQDAITCCRLAMNGITGPRNEILVGPRGFLSSFKWETSPEPLTRGLGEHWDIIDVQMKPFSGCKSTHSSVFGLLAEMEKHSFTADDILAIHIDQSSGGWQLGCEPWDEKLDPKTEYDCQFSLPYSVATAAYDKDVFVTSYTPEKISRVAVREFMQKITAEEDSTLPPWSSRLHIKLKNGTEIVEEYFGEQLKGTKNNPFTEEELADRFKKCAAFSVYELSDSVIASLIDKLLNLEKVEDVTKEIILPITPDKE